jgi:hypothetical protein
MISLMSFAAKAAGNPTRYYDHPRDVLEDSRLDRKEKLAVLQAWELEARELAVAAEESMGGGEPSLLDEVVQARVDLGHQSDPAEDAGAPTKHGVRKVGG